MWTPAFQRIGHGGASAIIAGNTLASFDAAHEIGVDMIEFDVRARGGELALAHTILHARHGSVVTLAAALRHLASPRFVGVELNADLKQTGCERALIDALRRYDLLDRTMISSQVPQVLDNVRALEPRLHVGISIGGRIARLSRHWRNWRDGVLAGLTHGRWDALMLQHRLIDGALVAEALARNGRVYAWTVNERPALEQLRGLGVHGIVSADPRIFV